MRACTGGFADVGHPGVPEDGLAPLLRLLASYEHRATFNQYRDVHPLLDRPDAAARRQHNLRSYLTTFRMARFILLGEAAGYAGCRFSGIAFTSEAQLIGPGRLPWAAGLALHQSSQAEMPWAERSATFVWEALGERNDCLLWNAFPWHPVGPSGPLSNRPPGRDLEAGLEVLHCLLRLFPAAQPVAVGRVAQRALAAIGIQAPHLRHPSHGGKVEFVGGVKALTLEN